MPPYPKSIDKMLLISRMIKILGLSDDERFYQEYDLATNEKRNFLKTLLEDMRIINILLLVSFMANTEQTLF